MSYAEFVERHMLGTMPSDDAITHMHERLLAYVRERDPLFLVRHVTGLTRGEPVRTTDGTRLLPADNAPAWWFHAVLYNDHRPSAEGFADFVATTPTHFFDVGRFPTLNAAGWHAAHLRDVKDGSTNWLGWTREDITRRFLRNVHPLNVFLVPKEDWRRVGGDPDLIGYVAHIYKARFPKLWDELSKLIGGVVARPDAGRRELVIESAAPGESGRVGNEAWDFVLDAHKVKPLGLLLSRAPDAASRCERLRRGLTVPRFVALADALYNAARGSKLEALAPGDPVRQAVVGWDILDRAIEKRFAGPTGWTAAIALLEEGGDEGMAALRSFNPAMLVTAALRVVDGPYRWEKAKQNSGRA